MAEEGLEQFLGRISQGLPPGFSLKKTRSGVAGMAYLLYKGPQVQVEEIMRQVGGQLAKVKNTSWLILYRFKALSWLQEPSRRPQIERDIDRRVRQASACLKVQKS